jgi:hypothetical protein
MNNMKLRTSIIVVIFISFLMGCTKGFEEINLNPNAPEEVKAELLLRKVIYSYGEEMSYEGFVTGNLLSQHFTMVDFNLFDRHNLTQPQLGGNPWPVIYSNLRDNNILLNQSRSKEVERVYEGPALIMKAYMTAALTDIFGDVPYSEALQGAAGNVTPGYDGQDSIYLGKGGILENLEKGIAAMESYTGAIALQGDLLFDGDLDAWKLFANSLRIKYLMRISDKVDVSAELQAIFASGDYITNNSQNAKFDFAAGRPNSFRMQQLRDGDFSLYVMSETAQGVFEDLNDPRREVFYRPIGKDATNSIYTGLLNGPDASATSISVSDYSLTGTIFRENTGDLDANFMTGWETGLLLAEAAEKGLITATAKTLYDDAVQQAFDYWNTPMPANYLLVGNAAYGLGTAGAIEQIITQKWIANSINGYESWIEYRRTGFPALKTVSASLNNDLIPVRLPYPTNEAALNAQNYNAAPENSVNLPVWWDN